MNDPVRRDVRILAFAVIILGIAVVILGLSTPRPAPVPQGEAPVRIGSAGPSVALVPALTTRQVNRQVRVLGVSDTGARPTARIVLARTAIGTAAFGGLATWYATPGFTAAAGPDLRAIRGWRGSLVKVTSRGRTVIVRLTDACWCPPRNGRPVLLDLSRLAFSRLASPSAGVIVVSVEVGGRLPRLPATDMVAP